LVGLAEMRASDLTIDGPHYRKESLQCGERPARSRCWRQPSRWRRVGLRPPRLPNPTIMATRIRTRRAAVRADTIRAPHQARLTSATSQLVRSSFAGTMQPRLGYPPGRGFSRAAPLRSGESHFGLVSGSLVCLVAEALGWAASTSSIAAATSSFSGSFGPGSRAAIPGVDTPSDAPNPLARAEAPSAPSAMSDVVHAWQPARGEGWRVNGPVFGPVAHCSPPRVAVLR
jgi:hypothetical protein